MTSWDQQTFVPGIEHTNSASHLAVPPNTESDILQLTTSSTMDPTSLFVATQSANDLVQPEDSGIRSSLPPMTPSSPRTSNEFPPTPIEVESDETTVPEVDGESRLTPKPSTKKRRSWGQQLPTPKTNLPPRKRAKTEDEKEQRRVERVLRNRRAAQSSRERKRQEVEKLEQRNKQLEAQLANFQAAQTRMMEEIQRLQRLAGLVPRPGPLNQGLSATNLTLSQPLFDMSSNSSPSISNLGNLVIDAVNSQTVDPTSLSPIDELTSVSAAEKKIKVEEETTSSVESVLQMSNQLASAPKELESRTNEEKARESDLTQHPAAMLCDLPCRSKTQTSPQHSKALMCIMQTHLVLSVAWAMISACQRPLTQINFCLKAGISLPATQEVLRSVVWILTRPRTTVSSMTSSSSSTNPLVRRETNQFQTRSAQRLSLRTRSLRKILTSSPHLARPLEDATMEALRLASTEERENKAGGGVDAWATVSCQSDPSEQWLTGYKLPSKEALLTLLWALRIEKRRSTSPDNNASAASSIDTVTGGSVRHTFSSSQLGFLKRTKRMDSSTAYCDVPSKRRR